MGTPYAYLRKSVIRRGELTLSPETQEREVRELAGRHNDNGTRLRILADWDISGRRQSRSKRKDYLKLLAAIESGECTAVYSYSLSRLSRSVSDLSALFDMCRDRKVPIRLVADNLDTSTASGMLTAHILSGMAQFESDVASERVHAMYETKRAHGEEIRTSRRYGERRVRADGTTTGDGEDEALVMAAFDEAGSYSGAAKLLNERHVKPRIAETWWGSSVAVVVQRKRPALRNRPSSRGVDAGGAAFMFSRLLRCPTCGHVMTGSSLKERNGGRRTRYACRNADAMPHAKVAITESIIAPWIREQVDALRPPFDQIEANRASAEERQRLEDQKRAVGDALVDGIYTREQARDRAAAIDARIAALEQADEVIDLPRIDWATWSPGDVNRVLRLMVDHVKLNRKLHPVAIEWRGSIADWAEDRA